ncbi:Phosphorylated CTD interacting factor 1 [Trypanosoma melophagium]|uniref:Phosphorylated CTD interacting factor 1 n=1 Tax=Trypanosoma melophagium TaxID=715481 RepID=UPI00351A13B4|nr:Phosphorylated CTD interacting factor 1 [Trypanosoma melophagium]
MKRTISGDVDVDVTHPAVCFYREVLINLKWSAIRSEFLEALQTAPHLHFAEPKKLWRHSQEALGKWVLSQVARDTQSSTDTNTCVSFFPRKAMLPDGTYDEQLIRDISLKCENSSSSDVIASIKEVLNRFNLSSRCEEAAVSIEKELETTSPSSYCTPSLSIVSEEDEKGRTAMQRRVQGSIVVIGVKWPEHVARHMRRKCSPVSIPLAAYKKLDMCYRHFADSTESVRYSKLDYESRFALRAATLALRYEGCLATGSLQLCADTRLKQYLHFAGYHVMDLCASPINAYMGSPKDGSYNSMGNSNNNTGESNENNSSLENENLPNHFCSAFFDTDRYFGSLGSAMKFDVAGAYNSSEVNPKRKPLLLTLDVPYDEDLCERLFLKLITDMKKVETEVITSENKTSHFIADYVLVLPLWWDVPMQRRKVLFTEAESRPLPSSAEEKVTLDAVIKERSAMLNEGYTVPYGWPQRLAEAAGEKWVCFDGVFVGGSYEYFCTATNKWLRGVTATEVIGLSQPREQETALSLESLLSRFYG